MSSPAIQIDAQDEQRGRTQSVHPINNDTHKADHNTDSNDNNEKPHSRRNSISAFVDRLRSRSRSRSRSVVERLRSRSRSRSRQRPLIDGSVPEEDEDKEYVYSRRKSTDMRGEYANVLRAQTDYMEKLREEQARSGVTHNVDGIPIPPPVNPPREGRRRSIIAVLSRDSSRTRSREPSMDRAGSRSVSRSASRTRIPEEDEGEHGDKSKLNPPQDREYKWSRRKSSEITGPYATALQSQLEYMEQLGDKQQKEGITHNADGIKIPGPVNPNVVDTESQPVTRVGGPNKMLI
ncbi:hypothetical protein BX616_003258 [Lobosporangium transversale]|uniref:Uncharacterized protein n=1 Tax=Lobosporangium transversale TaxID=64571 RepID=A0A1Y2G701_9FUNG|nr:hypothetical protein BCR41DRAFT_363887 [Lobosporangium transversale]KAF9899138.1 hypothetical protein BX616_003258 [Lobosporangium transversale]ORY99583.1 hypothetical protein BCR41DRAFT_363887 [Lobosporangium transversale]|eukprot:XP_021875878.1 hypothetical protein BCR41DRAFT_363887 [Lobosporangium transversale]